MAILGRGNHRYYIEARRNDDNTKHVKLYSNAPSTGQAIKKARPTIAKRLGTEDYTILSANDVTEAHRSAGLIPGEAYYREARARRAGFASYADEEKHNA